MVIHDEPQEPIKEIAQNHYAEYYKGDSSHESYNLPGLKSDGMLESNVLERVGTSSGLALDSTAFFADREIVLQVLIT